MLRRSLLNRQWPAPYGSGLLRKRDQTERDGLTESAPTGFSRSHAAQAPASLRSVEVVWSKVEPVAVS